MLAGLGVSSTSALGAVAISVIGLANIAGTIYAGALGKRFTKKYLLAGGSMPPAQWWQARSS